MRHAQTRRLHRARLDAVRSLLPDLRRRLVQPATRGARMGAISARQAITRSSTRRRARVRQRQPARPTAAMRRILPIQAAATFTRATTLGATSTPTRSAPARPARSCCAPVRPGLARPAEAPSGTMGYSRRTMGYSSMPHRGSRRRSTRHMGLKDRWGTNWVLPACTRLCEHGRPH